MDGAQRLLTTYRALDARLSAVPLLALLRNALLFRLLYSLLNSHVITDILRFGPVAVLRALVASVRVSAFSLLRRYVPAVRNEVNKEIAKSIKEIDEGMKHPPRSEISLELPAEGLSRDEINRKLALYQEMDDVDYVSGRVSAAVFHEKSELREIGLDAIARFLSANALHADIFQSTRQMEAEIVAMTLKLFKGNDEACGVLTSGGTESLSMAVKAYRDLARTERGVTDPELVAPVSIHPAVAKACHLFAIRLVTIPVDRDMRADIRGISRAITKNTIAIFGSAPSWPHGAIDDFVALGRIARKHNTGLHVDSCLGGFVLPFMADAGYAVPPFDFTVPGVTSISADIHKYGLAPKGNSVLMYSSPSIRRHQFFTLVDYPGGLYASPSFAGTRPGMLIAGAWATMLRVGKAGYVEVTADIIRTARTIRDRVPGLVPEAGWKVLGDPVAHVVAFTATTVDPLAVLDEMGKKGWHLAALQNPNGVQVAVTSLTVPHVEQLLRDWEDATRKVLSEPAGKGRWASMYASVKSVPDTRIIDEIVEGYLGALYKPV